MFQNILIPTDGSSVGNKAVKAGVELAETPGAKVKGFYSTYTFGRITFVRECSSVPEY